MGLHYLSREAIVSATPPAASRENMSDLHSAARLYAENGWAVFPIRPNSKEPLIREWQKLATTDLDQVDAWWTQWPDANIGFAPESAGLCVVDVDPGAVIELPYSP